MTLAGVEGMVQGLGSIAIQVSLKKPWFQHTHRGQFSTLDV